mgnify:CR=1 FL=1
MEEIVAIYCRISTQLQSTDRQREELLSFARDKGWEIPEDRIYIDVISGFKAGEVRPEYGRLMSELVSKGITCVLFSEFSRLARNATELLSQINFFRERNIKLFFEKQNIWVENKKNDLGNSILLHVLAVVSSYEVELFAEVTPKIASTTYGSEEYNGFLDKLKPALDHHYASNRHHPQHFVNGINDMPR